MYIESHLSSLILGPFKRWLPLRENKWKKINTSNFPSTNCTDLIFSNKN